ncbi:uncharacterized protein UBRO2_00595 [Ustilago bromivora]|nr:uncharacterized protein UBRO2_00595 [Ustilago bromivora]
MSNQGAEIVEWSTTPDGYVLRTTESVGLTSWSSVTYEAMIPQDAAERYDQFLAASFVHRNLPFSVTVIRFVALVPQYLYSSEAIPSEATDGARATGSIGKCGKYFTTGPGGIEFTVEAYIGSDMVDPPVIVEISDPRDITAAVGASSETEVADLGVVYDDDSYTLRATSDGTSKFTTGYGVSYVSLGIPTEVMDMLIDAINADFTEHDWARGASACGVPKLQTHDGYSWLPVKNPEELPGCALSGTGNVQIANIPRFIRDKGKSILCDAFVSMRLKRVTKTSIRNAAQWELAMTVSYVQVNEFTTKQSPPIYNTPSLKGRNREATDEVIAAIKGMSLT